MSESKPSLDHSFQRILAIMRPVLEAAIDPICLVNARNELVYANQPMRSLLGLKPRELKGNQHPVFCDLIKLGCCEPACQVQQTILSEVPIRLDEVPATRGGKRLRMTLKISPVLDPELGAVGGGNERDPSPAPASARLPVGALIVARDTSGEVVLQAKYHRLLDLLEEKTEQVTALNDRVVELQNALRRVRTGHAA